MFAEGSRREFKGSSAGSVYKRSLKVEEAGTRDVRRRVWKRLGRNSLIENSENLKGVGAKESNSKSGEFEGY